jgi:hypothetical protein
MTEKSSFVGKKVRLFLLILIVLLVPIVMDQAAVDRETVRWAGRTAAGLTVLLTVYGLFAKVFRTVIFVILGLVALVVLVSEGTLEAPRLTKWSAERAAE